MAMEEEAERREVIELDQNNLIKHKSTNQIPEDKDEKPTVTTSTVTKIIGGKRKRNTDEEQSRKHGENQEPNNKKHAAVYGNYDRYYGYRTVIDSDDDPRLKYFKQEWFEGKDCLDVGCNAGKLTIMIAKNFACKRMVGVDIDKGLVHRAYEHLQHVAKNMEANRKSNLNMDGLKGEETKLTSHETSNYVALNARDSGLSGEELLRRVSFKVENFISHMEAKPTYDTVLCLSVTKWVHLNWGDDGLIRLFAKIKNLLRSGGILVLEPQPWKSYKNNHLVSEVVRQNFHEIVLRPDNFKEVLLDRVGFRSMQNMTKETEDSAKGFSRPIYLIRC